MNMLNHLVKYGFLPQKQTVFLLCDLQEKFRPIISHFDEIAQSACRLVSRDYTSETLKASIDLLLALLSKLLNFRPYTNNVPSLIIDSRS